jgi:YVTN family beta-propeller protein
VIDTAKLVVAKNIALGDGMRPMGAVAAPDGSFVYVSTGRSRMVQIIDAKTDAVVGSVEVGTRPWGIAISPDGKTLFTANGPSNDVSVVDVASRKVTSKIQAARGPWGVVAVAK